uniref:Tyrosine-protein kinase ephrin type A/B receptor-like domain-containing protein n=1 Tax=Magallana gigas TaxID=29159 RepID=K1RGH0_MAGGI
MTSSNHSEDECLSLNDYTQPQPFRLYKRELPTVTEQIPGDGIDNDGDGLVDEEYCGFLWQDYNISDIDLDGSINEDCKGCNEGEELSPLFVCKDCDYAICGEGTKLNSAKENCEPCSIGFYKNVSANDTSLNITDRFECKKCPRNLTTYSTESIEISDCIEHCETGHYLSNNTCLPCEIGTYKNTSSRDVTLDEMLRWNCSTCKRTYTTISKESETCITDCMCACNMVHVQKNYTSSELSKIIEKMKKELMVNKEQLSSTLRKKISVKDNRPSSQSIGSFGVVIIVFVFSLLLAADVMILKKHISLLVRTLVDFAKRFCRK